MELHAFRAASLFYAAAVVLAFAYLFSRRERWSGWMLALLQAGLILHAASFFLRLRAFWAFPENRFYLPVNTFFGALSFMALAVAGVFFAVERRHRLGILGAFVLPWAALAAGAAALGADPAVGALAPQLRSWWINVHPVALMTAYAAFANAFGVGSALLIQERQIKSRRPTELCYRLPSLEALDALNASLISWAFPVLAVGIALGALWAGRAWGRFWGWDPKETAALGTALIYGVYLHGRAFSGQRGRRAVLLSMFGFVSVVVTFAGVNFLSEMHGYLSGRGGG